MKKLSRGLCAFAVLASASAFACAEQNNNRDGDNQTRKPPQEALAACKDLKSGDSCQFVGRRNDTLKGVCFAPSDDKALACKPTDMPKKPSQSTSDK